MKNFLRALLLSLATFTAPVFADSASATPEQTMRAYFTALQTRGLESMVDFMHPDEARRFKDMLMPVYEFEAAAQQRTLLSATFGEEASLDDVKAAPPEAFMRGMAKLMTAQTTEVGITFDSIEILGAVPEPGKGLVHVVSRVQAGAKGLTVTKLDVTTLKQHQGSWKIMLTGDMEGLAQALRAGVQAPRN